MCLATIDKVTKQRKYGYKVMEKKADCYQSLTFRLDDTLIPIGEWVDEADYSLVTLTSIPSVDYKWSYPRGWHSFATKKAAKEWQASTDEVVVKVELAEVCTSGKQNFYSQRFPYRAVTVSKYMKIIKEVT